MRVKILYFAAVRELRGVEEEVVELPDSASTVGAATAWLAQQNPALAEALPSVRFAVNEAFASAEDLLHEGDVLAFIPPVAGG
jgi:molybdopterin converting factor subunit 1